MNVRPRSLLLVACALLAFLSPPRLLADVGRWTSNGPDGAPVLALTAVPSEPSTVYLGTSRRLYRSVDAGSLWTPVALSGRFDFVVTTSAPSVVYAAGGSTLYRTTDGGATWVARLAPFVRPESASVDRNDPMALYVVTGGAVFRTADGGDSWQPIISVPARAVGIATDPAQSGVLYAATNAGVYRSPDRGATWTRTSLREATFKVLFDPEAESRLFALSSTGVQVSTNRGESWRRIANPIQIATHLAFDPADSSRLYLVSGGDVFSSSDGGETVTVVRDGTFGPIVVSGSSVVLAGSATGVDRSDDTGHAWSSANVGIRESPVRALAIDPTNPAVVFAGGFPGIYESHDGGGRWNAIPGSPEAHTISIDPANPSTLYASGRGVHKSTDAGRTWKDRSPAELVGYVAALVIDPNDARRVFASNQAVLRSLNGTEDWDAVLKIEDTVGSFYYPPEGRALAIAPSDSATVYVGGAMNEYADGFVSRSEDGGTAWSAFSLLDRSVKVLAIDPCDPGIVYAGTFGGVHRSTDGGATWSEPGLPGFDITSLVLDPRHSSSLFAGTSAGLFWTTDSGASWTPFEPALAGPIFALAIDSSGRFLHAGTPDGVFSLERTFEPCVAGLDRLCLLGARFELSVVARDPRNGDAVPGQGVPDGDRFGYFSFPALTGDARFPEVFVKMADASGLPAPYGNNVWVFHTSLTDLNYFLTVRDTQTGRIKNYSSQKFGNPSSLACGVADTAAFHGACTARTPSAPMSSAEPAEVSNPALSLLGGRFRATLQATDPRSGRTVEASAVPKADGFGYFSLPGFTGDPTFPEVFVKMTDGTALPGRSFWIFHSGLTDVEYTLTVTDQSTGAVRSYRRGAPGGAQLCGEADTSAFAD